MEIHKGRSVVMLIGRSELYEALRAAGYNIPSDAELAFRVPGGGDWSNMQADVDELQKDANDDYQRSVLEISWDEDSDEHQRWVYDRRKREIQEAIGKLRKKQRALAQDAERGVWFDDERLTITYSGSIALLPALNALKHIMRQ